ncbi:MAG: ATP-binding cassette domain-containing protein [Puniceicoccales bacterium]|nr:ATP-binding cassette domain-containing protein [Puniceicoccales bacterium]
MVPAVFAENLSVGHGGDVLINGLTLSVGAGEILAIVGRSGCGKSSLMRIFIGLERPMAGAVHLCGMDPAELLLAGGVRAPSTYGVMFQDGALWTSMTLLENVSLPLLNYSGLRGDDIRDLAAFKLALVGLAGSEDAYPHEISGGMAKRAAIARAMALDPAILFLDEPSAGLDPHTSRQLDELILQIRACYGTAIVFVSHELRSIAHIADRVAFLDMETKSMLQVATLEEIVTDSPHEAVREFFAGVQVPRREGVEI